MHDIFKDALRPFAPKGSLDHLTNGGSPTAEKVTPASELAARWIAEARRHEQAADEHFESGDDSHDEEWLLHVEIARVFRNCARELGAIT